MKRKPQECYCPVCNKTVLAQWEDFGIGAYEYWGAKGTHHDWQLICPECEEPVPVTNCDERRDHEKEDQHRENV